MVRYIFLACFALCFVGTWAASCSSHNDCSGNNWCAECGFCTAGAVGTTCCSHNDCSGSNCCDYCTGQCTSVLNNCSPRSCPSSTTGGSSCSSSNDCSGNNWCAECGFCTAGAVGTTCCSHNDCSGNNCCDYCTNQCTPTLANCNPRSCSSTTSASTSSTSSSPTTSASTTGTPNYNVTVTNVYVTSYGWNDNDDGSGGYGNDIIAYPNVYHGHAIETNGQYSNPCTFATDPRAIAPGTIIYVPHVRKYYVMEDQCRSCTNDWNNGRWHVDLWIGPNSASNSNDLYSCEAAITRSSTTIIVNPAPNLPVTTTKIFINGVCNA